MTRDVAWQSRSRTPDALEMHLAKALEAILGNGTHDLAGIIAELNIKRIVPPGGGAWTEQVFCAEMGRLAVGNAQFGKAG